MADYAKKIYALKAERGYMDVERNFTSSEENDLEKELTRKHYTRQLADDKMIFSEAYEIMIRLKNPHVEKYFSLSIDEQEYYNTWQTKDLIPFLCDYIANNKDRLGLSDDFQLFDICFENGRLKIVTNQFLNDSFINVIRDYYEKREMHITRMFGSYVLLQRINEELQAVLATEVPLSYCPLMYKLLKEVGGVSAELLLDALRNKDVETQKQAMLNLINEVVIKGGYFDTSRPLNSCEANVLFGASETLSSAFKNNLLDAAVIVSNNLGTIITTNSSNTQGAVKRMTGLFYTSPSKEITRTALDACIVPVFPITAEIDQLAGVKKAISMGFKHIAVTVAASDNILLEKIASLEKGDIKIYKFGLCSTGVSKETAMIMRDFADVIWTCASKYVKELVEPRAIAQVGVKIPVHIMSERGWEVVNNHLQVMNGNQFDATLSAGDNKPVVLNQEGGGLKLVRKKDLHQCNDCPHPCI